MISQIIAFVKNDDNVINSQLTINCPKSTIEILKKSCEICSKKTIITPERRQRLRSGVIIVVFEHISHLFLVLLLFNFEQVMLAGLVALGITFTTVVLTLVYIFMVYILLITVQKFQ